ncbi:hypothetical protein FJZ53_02870 [Candidatus Woesearchaeota archaeon]|nr:hypothetical protein [Candidatus Woesearchaeota archaeon]
MPSKKKHTLEKIADSLGKNFDEEKVHTALLLAYSSSIYSVISKDCTPCPTYRVSYDKVNVKVSMEETSGFSLASQDDALDISVVDEIFCCNIRGIPLLLEGETGIGKTYAAAKYLSTLLSKDNYFSHRLSANAFVNNLFSHFQEGKMVNGMPVIEANVEKIENSAGCIEDEINRGDPNETLQLFDNEMHLGGVIYKLGIPVPELAKGVYNPKSGKIKDLLIITAQNPAGIDDAKFTGTMQLDAAVDNRLLKVNVGNSAPSAGSTPWLCSKNNKPHEKFLEKFAKKASKYLGVEEAVFSNLSEDWLSTYAWISEASRTDKPILYSAMEVADFMIAVFSGNLIKYYDYEKRVVNDWNSLLKNGVKLNNSLQETETVKKIQEVVNSFKVPIIFRDTMQIKKVADVLATLNNIKTSLKSKNPVDTYLNTERYVTAREVSEATSLLARNKQKANSQSPINAVNEILAQYVQLSREYMKDANCLSTTFDLLDPNAGIKKVAVFKALKETLQGSKTVDRLVKEVSEHAKILINKTSSSEDLKNVLIARSVGDLMTLCGFLSQYKPEIEQLLKKHDKKSKISQVVAELGKFYYEKLEEDAMVMPDIYQHRIQRTLGI